jgi:hypothetical protein
VSNYIHLRCPNDLCSVAFDRIFLGGSPFEFSEVDFLTLVEAMRPYRVTDTGIVQHYTKGPHRGARYPPDVSVRIRSFHI